MAITLNWRRPLSWIALPILVMICFIGFPPPFAPPRNIRPAQEQSEPSDEVEGPG